MTSTPVSKDVGSVLMNMTSQTAAKSKAEGNFSDVLQKQSQVAEPREVKPQAKA